MVFLNKSDDLADDLVILVCLHSTLLVRIEHCVVI